MSRKRRIILAAVLSSGVVAAVVTVRACRIEENWSESYVLSRVAPAYRLDRLDGTPCRELCPRPSRDREVSIRHCGIGKRTYSPYILCEIGLNGPGPDQETFLPQALPFPEDLDPGATGAIDPRHCPADKCLDGYSKHGAYAPETFKVAGCRVGRNQTRTDDAAILVCSYTIEFGFFEAMDIMAR